MNKNTKTKLVDYFLQQRARGLQHRQYYEEQWKRNWLGYMNLATRPAIPNEYFTKKTRLADEFRIIETLTAQFGLGLYHVPNWLHVACPTGPGAFYEQLVEVVLRGGWDRADMTMKSLGGIKYSAITGHAWMKSYWEVQHGDVEHLALPESNFEGDRFDPKNIRRSTKPGLLYNGPQHYFPDNFNIVCDPTGQYRWMMERKTVSMAELKWKNSEYNNQLYDENEVRRIKPKAPVNNPEWKLGGFVDSSGAWTSGPWDTGGLIEYAEGVPEQRDPDSADKWEWWTWIPPEIHVYDDTQWRLIEIVNDEYLIRDVPAPTPDRRHPYDPIPAVQIPGRIFGESVLTMAEGLFDLRYWLEDARREEVAQKLWRPTIIDGNLGLSPESLYRKPGGVLFVDGLTGPINQHIMEPNQSDVFPSAYHEPGLKEQQMNKITSVTDPFQGSPAGGRTTATEISIIAQLGSSRYQLGIFQLGEMLVKKALQRSFALHQSRMDQPQLIELAGTPRRQYEVDMSSLLWPIDVRLDVGRYGSMNDAEQRKLMEMYQMFSANPVANQFLDHENIIYDSFMRAGDAAVARHVRTRDAVEAENAQMAQQAAQQQQAGIEGQQAIDTNRELARGFAQSISQGAEGGDQGGDVAGSLQLGV